MAHRLETASRLERDSQKVEPASGLERDYRQDEFPTRYHGQQDELPTVYRVYSAGANHLPIGNSDEKSNPVSRICGLRKTTFWLCITVILLLVLGTLVGGVLGSMVGSKKKSGSETKRCVDVFTTSLPHLP